MSLRHEATRGGGLLEQVAETGDREGAGQVRRGVAGVPYQNGT